jgi:tryptophan halogenase
MTPDERPPALPRTIGVVGGGTAGYFAALALKRRFPAIAVTVVESSAVPILGVGEATTTLMPPFLHAELGLDIVELFRAVKPTFKLGIKFAWGEPGDSFFTYPFGEADPLAAFAFDGHLRSQSLASRLIAADRSPILRGPDDQHISLLPRLKFAYHLDNAPFVAFLAAAARERGIEHVDMTIDEVVQDEAGVAALRSRDGRELRFDLYVDASGFRSLLLEQRLGSPFHSYASSLFCDRAIVATVPQRGPIQPYTTAETMDAGWCWRIPVEGEDHRGYVHASADLDEDQAIAEMRAKNPDMGEPWVVRFRSGRHEDFWHKNTVAIGNAYGFVEPLESTALHMVIVEIAYLLAGLEALADPDGDRDFPRFASDAVGGHWDYLRWFLAIHYRYNRRLDTPFWRRARAEVDVSGLEHLVDRYRREGPWLAAEGLPYAVGDPAFGYSGLMMMLLGQGVEAPAPRPAISRSQWEQRAAEQRKVLRWALPQREALAVLRATPELLAQFAASPSSWCRGEAERVRVAARGRQTAHPGPASHRAPPPHARVRPRPGG